MRWLVNRDPLTGSRLNFAIDCIGAMFSRDAPAERVLTQRTCRRDRNRQRGTGSSLFMHNVAERIGFDQLFFSKLLAGAGSLAAALRAASIAALLSASGATHTFTSACKSAAKTDLNGVGIDAIQLAGEVNIACIDVETLALQSLGDVGGSDRTEQVAPARWRGVRGLPRRLPIA